MKTEHWIWIVITAFLVLELILFIAIFRSNKKSIDEAKDKMDGNTLGIDDLQEWDMGILESERPFISGHYIGN
jgi:hypothetical protein